MALPLDTALETAIATIEQALTDDMTRPNARSAIASWREALRYIESLPGAGYTSLTQSSYPGMRGT
ncbi:MAG: hypothetical protein AAGI27_03585 [Pseudomonadota bacterium]